MEYWEEIVTKAEDIRLFDDLDANILAMYCEMLSRRDVLQRMLYTHVANTFTMSEDVLKSLQAQERLIASYAEKLGLTPNARARLAKKVAEEPKPNKFAKFSG
jgi:P27 family predicted phage terminase small subunit